MLHDIRNFCTAQILITERLLRSAPPNLTSDQMGLLRRANRQAQYMHRTIEDMQLLARLKGRRESRVPARSERLADVLQRALLLVRALHFDRPFEVSLECPAGMVTGDASLMESIFVNLFENAVRHTSKELKPELDVRVVAEKAGVVFTVRGGTPPDRRLLSCLFERYAKGAESTGSGLGLALIREIVEAVEGRIDARLSPAQQGEVFEVVVHLPNRPPLLGSRRS